MNKLKKQANAGQKKCTKTAEVIWHLSFKKSLPIDRSSMKKKLFQEQKNVSRLWDSLIIIISNANDFIL